MFIGARRKLRKRVGVYWRHVTFHPGRMVATIGEHQAIIETMSVMIQRLRFPLPSTT